MSVYGKALLVGLGLAASAVLWAAPASAQYYGGGNRDPYYEPGPRYGRGSDRGYDRGYDRGPRYDDRRGPRYDDRRGSYNGGNYDRGQRNNNPMAGMSLEDQKRALKNHREAQKKAIKRGYVIP